MTIKLIVLKSGEKLISEAKELISNESSDKSEPYGYFLSNPHVVTTKQKYVMIESEYIQTEMNNFEIDVVLTPWIILSQEKDFIIPINWVVTICEPLSSVKQMYIEKINSTLKVEQEENMEEGKNNE